MRGVEIAYVCLSASWRLIPLWVLDLCAYLDLFVIDLCVIDHMHNSEIAAPSNVGGTVSFLRGVHVSGSSVAAISMS